MKMLQKTDDDHDVCEPQTQTTKTTESSDTEGEKGPGKI